MKKIFICLSSTLLFLTSCIILVDSKTPITENKKITNNIELPKTSEVNKTSDSWDLSKIDLARNLSNWSNIEKDLVLATNMARTNPALFSKEYLEPLLNSFDGNTLIRKNGERIRTEEGKKAVQEAIDFLTKQKSLGILSISNGIRKGSMDHVKDIGLKGLTQHDGTDNSSPWDRMDRYGTATGLSSENISFGTNDGINVVLDLIVDDSVPSRGHRENIFTPELKFIGVACGEHKTYGVMCIQDFASGYTEKN